MDKPHENNPADHPTGPAPEEQGKQVADPAPITLLPPQEVPLASLGDILGAHEAAPAPVTAPMPERLNKDGSVPKKRGRKPGSRSAPAPDPEPEIEQAPAEAQSGAPAAKMSPNQAAKLCANLTINAAVIVFGEEIGAPKDDEPKTLLAAYKDYFDARGGFSVPPEVGLILAVGMYMAPRFMHEKSKPLRERVIGFVKKIFYRK